MFVLSTVHYEYYSLRVLFVSTVCGRRRFQLNVVVAESGCNRRVERFRGGPREVLWREVLRRSSREVLERSSGGRSSREVLERSSRGRS